MDAHGSGPRVVALDYGSFDPEGTGFDARHPWMVFWTKLWETLEDAGFVVRRADAVGSGEAAGSLLVSHGWTPTGARLVVAGAIPTVLFNVESPVIDYEFYHTLPRLSPLFHRVFVYEGAKDRVRPGSQYEPSVFPEAHQPFRTDDPPWSERRHIVAIHANKYLIPVSVPNLVRAVAARYFSRTPQTLKPSVRRQIIGLRDRTLARETYSDRLRLILHFAQQDDFDLYGLGWTGPNPYSAPRQIVEAARRRYRGTVDDKLETLRRYKFALTTENTSFPGFISEKIFDAFFAGAIPVFLGPRDVDRYIPTMALIDVRRYRDLRDLDVVLRQMSIDEAETRRRAARDFLASPAFNEVFEAGWLSRQLARAVADVARLPARSQPTAPPEYGSWKSARRRRVLPV